MAQEQVQGAQFTLCLLTAALQILTPNCATQDLHGVKPSPWSVLPGCLTWQKMPLQKWEEKEPRWDWISGIIYTKRWPCQVWPKNHSKSQELVVGTWVCLSFRSDVMPRPLNLMDISQPGPLHSSNHYLMSFGGAGAWLGNSIINLMYKRRTTN